MHRHRLINILICIVFVNIVIITCSGCFKIPTSGLPSAVQQAQDIETQASLRAVVTAAEQYAAQNEGTYDGMSAEELSNIDPNIQITDNNPEPGQVAVTSVSSDGYVLTAVSKSNKKMTATKTSGGAVVFGY